MHRLKLDIPAFELSLLCSVCQLTPPRCGPQRLHTQTSQGGSKDPSAHTVVCTVYKLFCTKVTFYSERDKQIMIAFIRYGGTQSKVRK